MQNSYDHLQAILACAPRLLCGVDECVRRDKGTRVEVPGGGLVVVAPLPDEITLDGEREMWTEKRWRDCPAPGKVDVVLGRDWTPPDPLNGRGLRQAALSSRLERASNVFSWQAFIGPQWPATKTERGQPDPNAPIGALEMRSCPIARPRGKSRCQVMA